MALAGRRAWAADHIPLGAQLYTVRKEAAQDLPRVLEQIARIGYQEVETYGDLYTNPAATLNHIITSAGLTVPSAHYGYKDIDTHFNYTKELGASWMVCSVIDPSLWGSAQGFATAAKQFNDWGQRAKDLGLRFAFHNHDYEFRPFSTEQAGKTGYDVLIESTDPNLVFFEVDC
jgi:sugar phosphate isomerase/epimerase